jgi:hypothetical protein
MVDYASEGILKLARGRARWFWPSIAIWSLFTILSWGHGFLVTFVCGAIAATFAAFWYFASQGKAWPFLVGVILSGLSTILSVLVAQFIPAAIHAFVTWRLWDSFITCCNLDASKALHQQVASRLTIPSRVGNAGPSNPFKPDLPRRVAEESAEPVPTAWQPYRPPTTTDGSPGATS